ISEFAVYWSIDRVNAVAVAVVVGFVGVWTALGLALHLDANQYLLLGVPLTVAFQLWVARRPLHELWVRPAVAGWRGGGGAIAVAVVLGLVALVNFGGAVVFKQWATALYSLLELGGAFGAGWALARLDRARFSRGYLPMMIAAVVGAAWMAWQAQHKPQV